MAKPKRATGQITVRCGVESHQQLLDIAAALGADLTGLVNQMIRESLPRYAKRAEEENARLVATRLSGEKLHVPTNEPVIVQMFLAARKEPDHRQAGVMEEVARRFQQPGDPPLGETVRFATTLMEKQEALDATRRILNAPWRWSMVPTLSALTQSEKQLKLEIEGLIREREERRAHRDASKQSRKKN
ncbi:MAG TPA: hypothetical protein VM533_06480 [Fimbriiglobus sp.]|jgi:hypothetical protein|nr:hypothetical protein [Fimbriiglobus sp.]